MREYPYRRPVPAGSTTDAVTRGLPVQYDGSTSSRKLRGEPWRAPNSTEVGARAERKRDLLRLTLAPQLSRGARRHAAGPDRSRSHRVLGTYTSSVESMVGETRRSNACQLAPRRKLPLSVAHRTGAQQRYEPPRGWIGGKLSVRSRLGSCTGSRVPMARVPCRDMWSPSSQGAR